MGKDKQAYDTIVYEKDGGVGVVTLNRPEVGNTIDRRLAEELAAVCAGINRDEDVRVVIVTGAGEKTFLRDGEVEENLNGDSLTRVSATVAGLASPVIAALNGDALGQGLELALACDIRIAVETACLGLPQVCRGVIPYDGATQRLPRLVGRARAMEMLFSGASMSAGEACQAGLVSKVVSCGNLMPVVYDMARTMASRSPLALKYAKEAIHKGLDMSLEQGLRLEADIYFLLQTTEDRVEGIRAFLEKRPPRFKGK